jgi:hypothetical protein
MTITDKLRLAVERIKGAQKMMDDGEHEEAVKELLEIRKVRLESQDSGYTAYLLAICYDVMEDHLMAARYIDEALTRDSLATPYHESFGIIMDRIRDALANPTRKPNDSSTPKLYEILTRAREADTDSHLAMAEYLMHQKDLEGALRILRAVIVLDCGSRKAWGVTMRAARLAGDATLLAQAVAEVERFRAGNRVDAEVFAIPGYAQG